MSRASAVRLSCIVITDAEDAQRPDSGLARTFSIVSSRSSVPSSAKYED